MSTPFPTHREAALGLINDPDAKLTRKAGSFLGQLCADDRPLSPRQSEWLATLLERAGLPPLYGGKNEN